jgi:hypothetical protein
MLEAIRHWDTDVQWSSYHACASSSFTLRVVSFYSADLSLTSKIRLSRKGNSPGDNHIKRALRLCMSAHNMRCFDVAQLIFRELWARFVLVRVIVNRMPPFTACDTRDSGTVRDKYLALSLFRQWSLSFSQTAFSPHLATFLTFCGNYKEKSVHNRKKWSYPCTRPSRLPHFLDNRITDGSEVVSLTRRPAALSMALRALWTFATFSVSSSIHSRQDSLDGGSARRKASHYLHTGQHTQTSMPQVGFEPTIPVFDRAKTVHALDLYRPPFTTRKIAGTHFC